MTWINYGVHKPQQWSEMEKKKMKIVNVWIEFYNVHSKQCVVKRIIASDKRVHMWYGMC